MRVLRGNEQLNFSAALFFIQLFCIFILYLCNCAIMCNNFKKLICKESSSLRSLLPLSNNDTHIKIMRSSKSCALLRILALSAWNVWKSNKMRTSRIVAHCCALLRINYFKHLEVKILHLKVRREREPLLVFARNVTKSRKRVCCVFAIRLSTSTPSYPLGSAVNTCWYLCEPAAEQYGSYRCTGQWPCDG